MKSLPLSRRAVLLALPSLPASAAAAAASQDPWQQKARQVAALLRSGRTDHGLTAVLGGVWVGDRPLLTLAVGTSMTGIPASTAMHFRAGGVTEVCLTTLLLRYVDQRRVTLDAPLSRWLPQLRLSDAVTLRMLANSTTGYPDYVPDPQFVQAFYKDPFREWTAQELIDVAFSSPQQFTPPGTGWAYSHTNFVILGEALQKIGGAPIRSLLRREVTGPLGLRETDFPITPEIAPPVLHAFTTERGPVEDSTFWNPSWVSHSGRIVSNLDDLGRLARAVGAGTLLSRQSRQAMTAPTTVGLGGNTPEAYFGMGIAVLNGWLLQNPAFGGYSAIFANLPSHRLSVLVAATNGATTPKNIHPSTLIFKEVAKVVAPDNPLPPVFH